MRPGFDPKTWECAKEETLQLLIAAAARLGMVTYGELAQQIRAISFQAHDPDLWNLLGEISEEEDQQGRGLLSVIVVHKNGDMEPGNGFFEVAARRGRDMSDRTKCWVAELHKVHGYWSNRQKP